MQFSLLNTFRFHFTCLGIVRAVDTSHSLCKDHLITATVQVNLLSIDFQFLLSCKDSGLGQHFAKVSATNSGKIKVASA